MEGGGEVEGGGKAGHHGQPQTSTGVRPARYRRSENHSASCCLTFFFLFFIFYLCDTNLFHADHITMTAILWKQQLATIQPSPFVQCGPSV